MKIVLCANTSWYLYNFRKNLIAELMAKGDEIVVIAPYDDYTKRLQNMGGRYFPLFMRQTGKNLLDEMRSFFQLALLLLKIRPDVVLSFTIKCNLYIGLLNRVCPFRQVANISGLGEVFEERGGIHHIIQSLYRYALKDSDKIFFQNKEDLRIFNTPKKLFSRSSEQLPGSGVDLITFTPSLVPKSSHQKRIFLMLGRMIPNKGYDLFLDAATHIKRSKHCCVEFWVLGIKDCSRKASVALFNKVLAYHDKEFIRYLPATDDVVPILQQADVVVLPSQYHEGVPRSLLEAMACGKPLITTNWKGCRDTVDEYVNGVLLKKNNLESLIQALEFFMKADRDVLRKMGAASRKKAENEFDEQFVIGKYLQAIAGSVRQFEGMSS